jgi:hypothetical protein
MTERLSSWIIKDLFKPVNEAAMLIEKCPISPKDFSTLINLLPRGDITDKIKTPHTDKALCGVQIQGRPRSQYGQILFNFVCTHMGLVVVPFNLFVFDEFIENMIPQNFSDQLTFLRFQSSGI